jgi:hypothetical protein
MAAAIMAPLSRSGNSLIRGEAEKLIKPSSRLTSLNRLQIYRESYWYRALDSLRDDFPGLRAVLGPRAYNKLAQAYLTEVPSRSFTMRNLGSRLEAWLKNHPEYGGANPTLALDMARLEWAHIEAFDGAAEKPLGPEDLLELHEAMVFALQPHISLLELAYPVDDLRISVQAASEHEGRGAASNAVIRRKERSIVRSHSRIKPAPTFLAVHRIGFIVYYRRLEADEFRILLALREGQPIGEAVASMDHAAGKLERWFGSWAQMGWLCEGTLCPK